MCSTFARSADYKSAIRQITNLRYEAALGAKHIRRWQGHGREADRKWLLRSCEIAALSAGRMPAAR
jgi:hypothetical protein